MNKANEHKEQSTEIRKKMKSALEKLFSEALDVLGIDFATDHNTKDTPKRLAKMYVDELFSGRYEKEPSLTLFPNAKNLDQIYTVGPIRFRSTCSHHFAPIIGDVWISVKPSKKLIGLSKFARIVHWLMARPHIQEEAIMMLADYLEDKIEPEGLAITMKAKHYCMVWRGVKDDRSLMTNTVLRGSFLENKDMKNEHYKMMEGQGYGNVQGY